MNKPKIQVETVSRGLVWKLLLVNILSCGLEACLAAGTVYIPPMLLEAGMKESFMTMVLAVGPLLGLIFIPMIGSASDSWHSRFGCRRPLIWILSLGVLLSLQVIPQARHLAALMYPKPPHWIETTLQAGGVCLMEFCAQACITLVLALLSDLFPEEEENHKAFSVNSLMTSLGGCLGFFLPAVDWSLAPIAIFLGGQEAFVYALLTTLFLGCLFTTAFIQEKATTRVAEKKTVTRSSWKSWRSRYCPHSCMPRSQSLLVALGRCGSACMSVFPCVYSAFARVPAVIWRLFVAETCSWMALMSIMFFFADYMGEELYQGVPGAEALSKEKMQYDEGVRMGSLALLLQCVVSVLCSTVMHRWVTWLGVRAVYRSGILVMVFATAVMSVSGSVILVTAMAAATGYTLCVLQVLPYTLLCLYHSDTQAFFTPSKPHKPQRLSKGADVAPITSLLTRGPAAPYAHGHPAGLTLPGAEPSVGSPNVSVFVSGGDVDCIPASERGICFDMAILDSAYLLSQVLPALCLGSIVQLSNSVRAYMASACCFSLLAFFCSTRVVYSQADLHH